MVDSKVIALTIALNAVAIAVLYQRFGDTPAVQTGISKVVEIYHRIVPPRVPDRCGALKWDHYVLVSNRVVTPDGVRPAAVHIQGSKIVALEAYTPGEKLETAHVLNFQDAVISPGVIDVHMHLNEPGREDWEGITTGTTAALVGGVTTVVDMPLNSFPVTTTLAQLEAKKKLLKAKSHTNAAMWGGIVPSNAADHALLGAMLDAGALGFKSFMSPSGINDFDNVSKEHIAAALPLLKTRGATYFIHAELVSDVDLPADLDPRDYHSWMLSRPRKFEEDAIRALVEVLDADTTPAAPGFRLHIAHLADAQSLDLLKEAQQRHPISAETVPVFLTFADADIPRGAVQFKSAPPIRDAANRARLVQGLLDGDIALVGSDHSPCTPALKQLGTEHEGNFLKAWGGISGVQYMLPAVWTALHAVGGGLGRMAQVLSEEPARLAGLSHRKGRIAVGMDADLVVWEPEKAANTSVTANRHRHKLSAFTDHPLNGNVIATIVNGDLVKVFGNVVPKPCGQLVSRPWTKRH